MTGMVNERLLLTVEETAQRLQIGRTLAWQLVREGQLPIVRLGRCVRVPLRALEEWIAQQAGEANDEAAWEPRRVDLRVPGRVRWPGDD
jgi:excisionase family DNA binding protein